MGLLADVSATVKAMLGTAQDEARALGHGFIGTEHLVIALLGDVDSPGVAEARRQGATAEDACRRADEAFQQSDAPPAFVTDEEALAAIGVDLPSVRARAEEEFGQGSVPMRVGAPAFTPGVKTAIEKAVEFAHAAGRDAAAPDDVLRAVIDARDSVGAQALAAMTTDLPRVAGAAASR